MPSLTAHEAHFTLSIDDVPGAWHVVRWYGSEALSSLYQYKIELLADDAPPPYALLGREALFTVHDPDGARLVHGVVVAASEGREGLRHRMMDVTLAPRAWPMLHSVDCRIFQHKTLREIVTQVLREHQIEEPAVRFELLGVYAPREYCVQYRESAWAFLSRLCEEAGVFYFFEHSETGHSVVFSDHAGSHRPIDGDPRVPFHEDTGAVEDAAYVSRLWATARVGAGRVRLRDYNFALPALDLGAEAARDDDADPDLYDYPGGYDEPDAGRRKARVRLEEQTWRRYTARGRGNCPRLAAGRRFTLDDVVGGLRDELAGEYLVTSVTHRGEQPAAQGDGTAARAPEYTNEFEVIPAAVPFRPTRATPRPTMHAMQTATVTGPAGEEVYTDAHGRIKVQFHWDLDGQRDERSSCWIRVAQAWAGHGWGAQFIPRVGMEVMVSFLHGDPDQPVAVGCVYNGANPLPFGLPEHKTRSGIRTQSSLGGGGFNELAFEDAKGAELVHLHAQRDLDEAVERDHASRVGRDESARVTRHHVLQVGGNQTSRVEGDRRERTGGDHKARIEGNHETSVGRDETVRVEGDRYTVSTHDDQLVTRDLTTRVGGRERREVEGASDLHVKGDLTTRVNGNHTVVVGRHDARRALTLHAEGQCLVQSSDRTEITSEKELILRVGASRVRITEDRIELSSKEGVTLRSGNTVMQVTPDQARVRSKGKLVLSADTVTMRTDKAQVKLTDEARVTGSKVHLAHPGSDPDQDDTIKPPKITKIKLKDQKGRPLAHQRFVIRLGDGSEIAGVLDRDGKAEVELEGGAAEVTFPDVSGVKAR